MHGGKQVYYKSNKCITDNVINLDCEYQLHSGSLLSQTADHRLHRITKILRRWAGQPSMMKYVVKIVEMG